MKVTGIAIFGDKAVANLNNVDVIADYASTCCLYTNSDNKDITLNVVGGTLSNPKATVAYISAVGSYTFNGTKISGKAGIEVAAGDLVLKNHSTINTTGELKTLAYPGDGFGYDTGCGILMRVDKDLKEPALATKLNVNITNSTITSEHDYALRVAEFSTSARTTQFDININHDSSSSLHGGAGDYKNFRLSGNGDSKVTITENNVKQSV